MKLEERGKKKQGDKIEQPAKRSGFNPFGPFGDVWPDPRDPLYPLDWDPDFYSEVGDWEALEGRCSKHDVHLWSICWDERMSIGRSRTWISGI